MVKVGSLASLAVLFGCFAVAETQGNLCSLDGMCYRLGETVDINCSTYTCMRVLWSGETYVPEFRITTNQCNASGTCHPLGANLTTDCQTYTCTMETLSDGTIISRMLLTKNRCTDDSGYCRENGARRVVARDPNGELYRNCTCLALSNGARSFKCYIFMIIRVWQII